MVDFAVVDNKKPVIKPALFFITHLCIPRVTPGIDLHPLETALNEANIRNH